MPEKPSVFMGTSSEGLPVARALRTQLKGCAEVVIWNEGVFSLGEGTLETLVTESSSFDFAVLIMTPDDLSVSRGGETFTPRDNVIFECGLFMGVLGHLRTFIVYDIDKQIKIPSDLSGITFAVYHGARRDNNLLAAVGEAADPIRDAISKRGCAQVRPRRHLPAVSGTVLAPATRPTVWFLGSYTELQESQISLARKILPVICAELARMGARIICGESKMLDEVGKLYRDAVSGMESYVPNPIRLEGSLRSTSLNVVFAETIGVKPDVAIVIGGSAARGRVVDEAEKAAMAAIPVIAVCCTGGAASTLRTTAPGGERLERYLGQAISAVDAGDLARDILQVLKDTLKSKRYSVQNWPCCNSHSVRR